MKDALAMAVQKAAVPLPAKPKLVDWVTKVNVGGNRLQLRSAEFAYTLGHEFFVEVFLRVEPLLDGKHTLDEIVSAGEPEIKPTTVIFLLKMLRGSGLLVEGETPAALEGQDILGGEPLAVFLSHLTPEPLTALALLKQSRVGVVGSGKLASDVLESLRSVGTGQVVGLFDVQSDCVGSLAIPDDELQGFNLLVVCADSPGFVLFDSINTACLRTGTTWLHLAITGTTGILGPTIVPHQTACYTCYIRRLQSNLPDYDEHEGYRRHPTHRDASANEGIIAPFWRALASQAGMEVVRWLTGVASVTTLGRLYELSARSPATKVHDVLRVPRCPSCGRQAPPRYAWAPAWTDPVPRE